VLILLLGDCHGRLDLVHQACLAANAEYGVEAAIQVGDFGFFPKILNKYLHEGPRRFPVPLYVIDGNHEDHGWLLTSRTDGTLAAWASANLYVQGRGSVAEIGGMQMGFLGGALHADRRQEWSGQWKPTPTDGVPLNRRRTPRDPAWANWVTEGDVERAITAFTATPPDLLITHSCPAGIGVGMVGALPLIEDVERFISRAGHHSGPFHDCGEGGLTAVWHRLSRRPPCWVFGHFHQFHDRTVADTRFVCVGSSDGSDGAKTIRPVLLDTIRRCVFLDPVLRHSTRSESSA
jgi:predicted phosphodiesterase